MPLTGDINSNLGHVFLVQNRFLDAERLYQLTIRNLPTSSKTASGENAPSLLECAAFAQYKQDNRDEDASQSMLKAIHLQPSNLQYWYNAALISKHYAENSMVKPNRVAGDIVTAISHLTFAKSLFGALGKKAKKHATVDRKKSELFEKECSVCHDFLLSNNQFESICLNISACHTCRYRILMKVNTPHIIRLGQGARL